MIIHGDAIDELKKLDDGSIDAVITDPPYGYSFMGKDWDKAVPSVDIWRECLRALKPGGWCMVMSAPRSDVQNAMISRLMEAGFRLDFTPIYWTYASGFPKAGNIGKMVDKRMGAEGEYYEHPQYANRNGNGAKSNYGQVDGRAGKRHLYRVKSPEAKALDGSYAGFQPKPAVEVVIVAMKPLSEKTYVDQALKNGKGITWLDDCRVPTKDSLNGGAYSKGEYDTMGNTYELGTKRLEGQYNQPQGRFPANLLVSNSALGDYSKFFDLDKWADTLPFLPVSKASKKEKGIDNNHPTVKPQKLMAYLVALTTREGDTVLDPFAGSGTTVIAAKAMGRSCIGIEKELEYADIAKARLGFKK